MSTAKEKAASAETKKTAEPVNEKSRRYLEDKPPKKERYSDAKA